MNNIVNYKYNQCYLFINSIYIYCTLYTTNIYCINCETEENKNKQLPEYQAVGNVP